MMAMMASGSRKIPLSQFSIPYSTRLLLLVCFLYKASCEGCDKATKETTSEQSQTNAESGHHLQDACHQTSLDNHVFIFTSTGIIPNHHYRSSSSSSSSSSPPPNYV